MKQTFFHPIIFTSSNSYGLNMSDFQTASVYIPEALSSNWLVTDRNDLGNKVLTYGNRNDQNNQLAFQYAYFQLSLASVFSPYYSFSTSFNAGNINTWTNQVYTAAINLARNIQQFLEGPSGMLVSPQIDHINQVIQRLKDYTDVESNKEEFVNICTTFNDSATTYYNMLTPILSINSAVTNNLQSLDHQLDVTINGITSISGSTNLQTGYLDLIKSWLQYTKKNIVDTYHALQRIQGSWNVLQIDLEKLKIAGQDEFNFDPDDEDETYRAGVTLEDIVTDWGKIQGSIDIFLGSSIQGFNQGFELDEIKGGSQVVWSDSSFFATSANVSGNYSSYIPSIPPGSSLTIQYLNGTSIKRSKTISSSGPFTDQYSGDPINTIKVITGYEYGGAGNIQGFVQK